MSDPNDAPHTEVSSTLAMITQATLTKARDWLRRPSLAARHPHLRREPMAERSDHWYVIATSAEVRGARPTVLWRFGERYVLWRDRHGQLACLRDVCPHRGASLGLGRVVEGCLECPYHGFQFDRAGACTSVPAEPARPIPRKLRAREAPVAESMGWVWMWRGATRDPLPPPPDLELVRGYRYGDYAERVRSHFTRILEAQIDYTHVPFVHGRSFGMGMRAAMEVEVQPTQHGFRAELTGDHPAAHLQWVELVYPNLWLNAITPALLLCATFAPVDDTTTVMYLRWYQSAVDLPVVGAWLAKLGAYWSRIIIREDAPVVASQVPQNIDAARHEVLIASDAPVALYRRLRRAALAHAQRPADDLPDDVRPLRTKTGS